MASTKIPWSPLLPSPSPHVADITGEWCTEFLTVVYNHDGWNCSVDLNVAILQTGGSAIADGLHDALRKLKFSQLLHNHNRFTALFPGPPGRAGAKRELVDFMVQGRINRGRHTDRPVGCHSIQTNRCPPPPSPIFSQLLHNCTKKNI